ncbi:MAG TPA: TetR/AcrR family transcriptional regulator [Mesorhizobium sp.]|jgi:AcrR family transcriptional regulator
MALDRDGTSERVLEIAETLVSQGGAPNLKARSIAEKAGIAVGSVYNLFGDLDRLHGQVNMRLLDRLSDAGTRAMAEMQEKGVRDTRLRSLALARAYLQFVQEQPQSWAALLAFNPRRAGPAAAVAFERRLDALFDIIAEVLAQDAKLDLDGQQAKLTARVLWSSVHGIVVNGVRRRQQDRHGQGVWDQIDLLVTTFLRGVEHRAAASHH